MTALAETLSLFKVVDDRVRAGPAEVQARVAAVLPAYQQQPDGSSAVGWIDRFDEIVPGFFTVADDDEALARIADGAELPTGRWRSRQLLAVSALVRADPVAFDPGGTERDTLSRLVDRFTRGPVRAPGGRVDLRDQGDRTRVLLELLTAPGTGGLDQIGGWTNFIVSARNIGLIDAETAAQEVPPCQGSYTTEPGPDGGRLVTVLTTHAVVPNVAFDDLGPYLDPQNWPTCCPLWCSMEPSEPPNANGVPCYVEVISLDCPNGTTLTTCLEFGPLEVRGAPGQRDMSMNYQLCTNPAHANLQDGVVEVDAGSILVYEQPGGLCIDTTKRIRFRGTFDGAALAMWACALGYASAAEDMAMTCAGLGEPPDMNHPINDPPASTVTTRGDVQDGEDTGAEVDVGAIVDRWSKAVVECIEASAETFTTFVEKAAAGEYTADAAAKDAGKAWARMITEGVRWWAPPKASAVDADDEG